MQDLTKINKARELIDNSKFLIAMTGAGISVESGIPDFRSPGGLWEKYNPSIYASYEYFFKDPSKFWEMAKDVFPMVQRARPNRAHQILASLEEEGKLKAVITQNIDNLHQEAGTETIVELHGTYRELKCPGCGQGYGYEKFLETLDTELLPNCYKCKEVLKPEMIFFGEQLKHTVLEEAMEYAKKADLMLLVGTSLEIYPGAILPKVAKENGAKIIYINIERTSYSRKADVFLKGSASEILKSIVIGD